MIAHPVAVHDRAFDPRRAVVEDRCSEAASVPTTVVELGDNITRLLAEE